MLHFKSEHLTLTLPCGIGSHTMNLSLMLALVSILAAFIILKQPRGPLGFRSRMVKTRHLKREQA